MCACRGAVALPPSLAPDLKKLNLRSGRGYLKGHLVQLYVQCLSPLCSFLTSLCLITSCNGELTVL